MQPTGMPENTLFAKRFQNAGNGSVPPYSLTGAQCTARKPKTSDSPVSILCHWLACSFEIPADRHADVDVYAMDLLKTVLADMVDTVAIRDRGLNGYSHALELNATSAILAYHPQRPEMGIYLSIPGEALQTFCREGQYQHDLSSLCNHLLRSGGRPTRCDIAYDDFAGVLNMDTIEKSIDQRHLTSNWRTARIAGDYNLHAETTGADEGRICIFGSRQSETYARIYDKALEQARRGCAVEYDKWIRCEVELKGKHALVGFQLIQRNNPAELSGYLYSLLDFKKADPKDSNKRRWKTAGWWLTFLDHVKKVRLTIEREQRSVEKVIRWVDHQVKPSLALLAMAHGKGDIKAGVQAIMDAALEGAARLKKCHYRMLHRYLENLVDTDDGSVL